MRALIVKVDLRPLVLPSVVWSVAHGYTTALTRGLQLTFDGMDALRATPKLTAAEERVYQLLIDGLTDQQIARRLRRSLNTIKSQKAAIYEKYEVHSRIELLTHHFHATGAAGLNGAGHANGNGRAAGTPIRIGRSPPLPTG